MERLGHTSSESPSDAHAIDAALLLRLSDHSMWGGEYGENSPDAKLLAAIVQNGLMQVIFCMYGACICYLLCKELLVHTPGFVLKHAQNTLKTTHTQVVGSYIITKKEGGASSESADKMREQLQLLLCGLAARALGVGGKPVVGAHRGFVMGVMNKTLLSK
jgi:hypothetical protein